jgi:hypothetical protein
MKPSRTEIRSMRGRALLELPPAPAAAMKHEHQRRRLGAVVGGRDMDPERPIVTCMRDAVGRRPSGIGGARPSTPRALVRPLGRCLRRRIGLHHPRVFGRRDGRGGGLRARDRQDRGDACAGPEWTTTRPWEARLHLRCRCEHTPCVPVSPQACIPPVGSPPRPSRARSVASRGHRWLEGFSRPILLTVTPARPCSLVA